MALLRLHRALCWKFNGQDLSPWRYCHGLTWQVAEHHTATCLLPLHPQWDGGENWIEIKTQVEEKKIIK